MFLNLMVVWCYSADDFPSMALLKCLVFCLLDARLFGSVWSSLLSHSVTY